MRLVGAQASQLTVHRVFAARRFRPQLAAVVVATLGPSNGVWGKKKKNRENPPTFHRLAKARRAL